MDFDVRNRVKDFYGNIAKDVSDKAARCCGAGGSKSSCCGSVSETSTIYKGDDLANLPKEAVNASLGCANPVVFAELKDGETVLDLGSGGGINVLMASKEVGVSGRVYGLDMTDEMLALANTNKLKAGVTNVDFLKGYIEDIPLKDGIVDVIISNCVINLSDNKEKAMSEAHRVLKEGGRLAIADIISLKEIPSELKEKSETWCACLGGALTADEYESILKKVGFKDIEVLPVREYTKSVVEDAFEENKTFRDSTDGTDLELLDTAFDGAYIKAYK